MASGKSEAGKVEQPPVSVQYEDGENDSKTQPPKLKPACVVTFTKDEATFHNKEIQKILDDNNANDDHVFVISISGVFRSGKSFLINLMANYLDYYLAHGSDDGWEKSSSPITGINWAKGGNKSVTQGIWMIVYPTLVEKKRIVFMDCQGTGDNLQSTKNLDNMIMFYALKMSNLTIANTKGNVDSQDLEAMGVCVLSKSGQKGVNAFQDLWFLVRDWDYKEDPTSLEELVKNADSEQVKTSCTAVIKACRSVKAVGLPYPGRKVPQSKESDQLRVQDIDEDFILPCKPLFHEILVVKPSIASTENASGFYFGHKFQVLGKNTVGKIHSQMEAYLSTLINDAYEEAQDTLEKEIKALLQRNFRKLSELEKLAGKSFEKARRQYSEDERVVEHASEKRKEEDIKRMEDLVKTGVDTVKTRMDWQEAEKQARKAAEEAERRTKQLEKKQKELEEEQRKLNEQRDREEKKRQRQQKLSAQHAKEETERKLAEQLEWEQKQEEIRKKKEKLDAEEKRHKQQEEERQEKEDQRRAEMKAEEKRKKDMMSERDRLAQRKFERTVDPPESSFWCLMM